MIHVTFSDSSAASVKHGIKGEKKVIHLRDNLSEGQIYKDVNYEVRKDWITTIGNDEEIEFLKEYIIEGYENFFNDISKIRNEDKIYVWVGDNSLEQCGLMYFLTRLNRYENVYIINVSTLTFNEGELNEFTPRAVGEIVAEKLNIIYNREATPLTPEKFYDFTSHWNTLIEENSTLRILKNGKVISVGEDFYDDDILKYTKQFSKNEYVKSTRVIGHILGYSEDIISDSYLFWRIKELIKQGKLDYKGNQCSMRYLEIKIK